MGPLPRLFVSLLLLLAPCLPSVARLCLLCLLRTPSVIALCPSLPLARLLPVWFLLPTLRVDQARTLPLLRSPLVRVPRKRPRLVLVLPCFLLAPLWSPCLFLWLSLWMP